MCGKSSISNTSSHTNSTIKYLNTEMQLDDYFFLDPVFIIAMLVLIVIIVIIVSWWLQRRKLAAEQTDVEKDRSSDSRNVEISGKNLEVLEGLLNTVVAVEEGNETESLLVENGKSSGKHTSFGPITKLHDGDNSCSDDPDKVVEVPFDPDKIMTIIPDKDFRDFPKTEEDQMKMRRKHIMHMLSLPPLT